MGIKIPEVVSQGSTPDSGFSTARLQAPRNEGQGFSMLGQDMQSIVNLYPSFLHAQDQRNAIGAKAANFEKSLQAGAEIIATRGKMTQEIQTAMQQMDQAGRYGTIDYTDDVGEPRSADPQEYMAKRLSRVYGETVNRLMDQYQDPVLVGQIGQELEKEALTALSQFSNATLTKRIQTGQAQLDQQLAVGMPLAADPTNPNRDQEELRNLALIDDALKAGMLTPLEAQQKRKAFADDVHDTRWSIIAKTNPEHVLAVAAEVGNTGDFSVPMGMDPKQLPKYVDLANGTLSAQYTRHEQADKLREEQRQTQEAQDVKMLQIRSASGEDITNDIIEGRSLWSPGTQQALMTMNHTNKQARRAEFTDEQRMQSKTTGAGLIEQANLAKFNPELLGTNGTVNEAKVMALMKAKQLHPDDVKPVLEAIDSARMYLNKEDSSVQKSKREAMKYVEDAFIANPLFAGLDTVELKNMENAAKVQLMSALETKDPKVSDMDVAIDLVTKYDARLVGLQKRKVKQIKGELNAFEDSFPLGTFGPDHVMNPDARKRIESLPLMRSLLRRYENLQDIYKRRLEMESDSLPTEGTK